MDNQVGAFTVIEALQYGHAPNMVLNDCRLSGRERSHCAGMSSSNN
jgi:hypothetical protein